MNFKTKRQLNFIQIGLIFTLVTSTIIFVFSSFYDLQIAEFFARGFDNIAAKIWIVAMDEMGNHVFEPVIFIIFAIWWETFVMYQMRHAKNQFFNKHVWARYIYYIVCFVLVAIIIYFQTVARFANYDDGFGKYNDPKLEESISFRHWAYAGVRVFQISAMIGATIWFRTKFIKRTDVFTQEYYLDAVKSLFYMFSLALMVLIIKWSFGRTYYYNTIFESILTKLEAKGWVYNPEVVKWGTGADGSLNAPYFDWWDPNDFLNNLKYWFGPGEFQSDNAWWNRAFPSGHTCATFSAFGIWFCFLGENKGRQVTKKKIVAFIGCFILINSLKYSLLVYRFHWISDLEFSTVYSIIMIPVINYFVNKYGRFFINLFQARVLKHKLHGEIKTTKVGFHLFVKRAYGWQKIGFYFKSKANELKIANKVKKYNLILINEKQNQL